MSTHGTLKLGTVLFRVASIASIVPLLDGSSRNRHDRVRWLAMPSTRFFMNTAPVLAKTPMCVGYDLFRPLALVQSRWLW